MGSSMRRDPSEDGAGDDVRPDVAGPHHLSAGRPLSDIREVTEPNLVDISGSKGHRKSKTKSPLKVNEPSRREASVDLRPSDLRGHRGDILDENVEAGGSRKVLHDVPPNIVPIRLSSSRPDMKKAGLRSQETVSCISAAPPRGAGYSITNRGRSRSPVRDAVFRYDPVSSTSVRRPPSRTYIRPGLRLDLVDDATYRHHRLSVELKLGAALFVGGGSIDGTVRVVVDDSERIRHRKSLALMRISVDVLGLEEVSGDRRAVFLDLATDIVDAEHPPPDCMVNVQLQSSVKTTVWYLVPSISEIPFLLSMPLDVGPPPFQSKKARIRYLVSATVLLRDCGKQYIVRTSQEVDLLSVYDRKLIQPVILAAIPPLTIPAAERALASLPSPLTVSDELLLHHGSLLEVIRLTAGVHRQVWVSGTSIFVDVHIANSSRKILKKIELQLEQYILCYKYVCSTPVSALSKAIAYIYSSSRQQQRRWRSQQARHVFLTVVTERF